MGLGLKEGEGKGDEGNAFKEEEFNKLEAR